MRKVVTFAGTLLVLTIVACGNGDIGEDCDEEGLVGGECVDGAVCAKKDSPAAGSLVCLKQCAVPSDCGSNQTCGDVGGTSLKGCRATPP
jgi:hypothetical protein